MKIAVMLRTLDEKQGIGIYARNLMSAILKADRENRYHFIYGNAVHLGSFGKRENLREHVIPFRNKLLWDQLQVPRFAGKKMDLIFNTKFSVPLFTGCRTAMVFHGSEWYVYPEFYSRPDILYNRIFLPLYCGRAAAASSVSRVTADDMARFTGMDEKKIHVVHSACHNRFRAKAPVPDFSRVKERYGLPDRFILFVGKLYPGKNFSNIVRALALIRKKAGPSLKLVSAGDLRWKYEKDFEEIEKQGLKKEIVFTGWMEQEALPPLYRMAELLLFPSLYEGFGIPIVEAMASGCPVVTSTTGACPEVAGDAALLADPLEPREIAGAALKLLEDGGLRNDLIRKGYKRAGEFTWEKTALKTIAMFREIRRGTC